MKSTRSNCGFSLVELIVVVAIMAVLMGILIPTLVKQTSKSKRSVDSNSAHEIAASVNRVLSTDTDIYYTYSGDTPSNYSFVWDSGTTADDVSQNPFAKAVFEDFGQVIPVSKWNHNLKWMVTYNGTTVLNQPIQLKVMKYILILPAIFPKHWKKISMYKNKHKNREAQSECFSVLLNIIL